MRCSRCDREAIIFQRYSGLRLCGDHLGMSLETRAKRAIRSQGGIRPGERIAIAVSEDPISASLLHLFSVCFGKRRDLSLVAITPGWGAGSGRNTGRMKEIAGGLGIEWAGAMRVEGAGDSCQRDERGILTCSSGPIPEVHTLPSRAKRLGVTKLALGTTIDEAARSVLLRTIEGKASLLAQGSEGLAGDIPVLRPFSRIPEEEILLYAGMKGFPVPPCERPYSAGDLEAEAWRFLSEFTRRHPSVLFSLANLGDSIRGWGSRGGEAHPCGSLPEELPSRARPAHRRSERVTGHE
jgi:tRNA(Ile)-lysidine synthase TilS/MesJ